MLHNNLILQALPSTCRCSRAARQSHIGLLFSTAPVHSWEAHQTLCWCVWTANRCHHENCLSAAAGADLLLVTIWCSWPTRPKSTLLALPLPHA